MMIADEFVSKTDNVMLGYGSNIDYLLEFIFVREPNPTYKLSPVHLKAQ